MKRSGHLSRMLVRGRLLVFAVLAVLPGVSDRVFAAEAAATAMPEPKPTLRTVEIPVDGMACFVCAGTVKNAVKSLPGVLRVEVSLEARSARVTYFGDGQTPDRIVAAIDKLGYTAGMPREVP